MALENHYKCKFQWENMENTMLITRGHIEQEWQILFSHSNPSKLQQAGWGWCIKANDVSVYWRCAATSEGARIPLCSQTGAALGLVSPDGPPGRSHLTYLFFNGGQLRDASQESETWTNKKQPMLHPQEGPEWFIQCINIYTHIYTHTYPWVHFNIVVQ